MATLLMDATEIAANPAGWLAARRPLLTASEIPKVLGLAPQWGSAYSVYTEKLYGGQGRTSGRTRQQRYGNHHESFVADEFAADHPELVVVHGGLYAHGERPWQAATFDRIGLARSETAARAYRAGALPIVIQIKTADSPADGWGDEGTSDIPDAYLCQVVWEMDVAGADLAYVPVWFTSLRDMRTYVVRLDDPELELTAVMRAAGAEFMERLGARREPEIDWTPHTAKALGQLNRPVCRDDVTVPWHVARRYRRAVAAADAAEQRLGLAGNVLRQRLGAHHRAIDPGGVRVATRSVYVPRRVDLALLRAQHPAVAGQCTVQGEVVDKLLPNRTA